MYEKHKKGVTTTKDYAGNLLVFLAFKRDYVENVHRTHTRATGRGPPGSTIIILKEIRGFNNNNKQTEKPTQKT